MRVLVLAKQIPDVNKIQYDPVTNRIIRENVPLSMNSFDRKALEEAIRMKENHGFEVVVASMGPPQARDILNEALKMGADSAYLISDRKFGGSDTLATSKILSQFAVKIKPDLILAGKYSLDGETSQVPPEVAHFLGYSFRSSVSRIDLNVEERKMTVEQDTESGSRKFRVEFPALLSVSEKINRARAVKPDAPDMSDRVIVVDSSWIGTGIDGREYSPTVVAGTTKLESTRSVRMLDQGPNLYSEIMSLIQSARVGSRDSHDRIRLPEFSEGRQTILGVAVGDPSTSMEISSKISDLAVENGLNVEIMGNIDPDDLGGMVCHIYHYVDSQDYIALASSVTGFIRERKPLYVVFPSNTDGRDVAATVAADLELGLTADCVDLKIEKGKLIQYKPAFGGNIIASIFSKTSPEMATVRPGMFRRKTWDGNFRINRIEPGKGSGQILLETSPVPSQYRPLRSSDIIIGFGRGVRKRDTVNEILSLANALGASVGATRPMVDMNFIPRQQQIGLTGVSVSPAFYIALGISGQANHVVGIRYARRILAVNSDPNADMFRYSDFGLVMDLNEFIQGFREFLSSGPG